MLCGHDTIPQNIPTLILHVENILHNIINPIEYCYEYE